MMVQSTATDPRRKPAVRRPAKPAPAAGLVDEAAQLPGQMWISNEGEAVDEAAQADEVDPAPAVVDEVDEEPRPGTAKQTTRLIKVACSTECKCGGYVVRTSRKWLKAGPPKCPFGTEMREAA